MQSVRDGSEKHAPSKYPVIVHGLCCRELKLWKIREAMSSIARTGKHELTQSESRWQVTSVN